jgi:hypothetical protein
MPLPTRQLVPWIAALCIGTLAGCDSHSDARTPGDTRGPDTRGPDTSEPDDESSVPAEPGDDWLRASTISLRNRLQVPGAGARLDAAQIVNQLQRYDPGSLLRCEVQDDPAYRAAVDALGGVHWGYAVQFLEDLSKPQFLAGPPPPVRMFPSAAGTANAGGGAAAPVEIEEADIVGLSETAALFYSTSHGLLLVDLAQAAPRFRCAVKLPGQVKSFFYYREHLVAMVGATILHFKLLDGSLQFVESIKLRGTILDTRRFNDKLVIYTQLAIEKPAAAPASNPPVNPGFPGGLAAPVAPYVPPRQHRALEVYRFGDRLSEELSESLINTTVDDVYLRSGGGVPPGAAPGTVVHTASSFGDVLWASDHYFVVTEMLDVTKLSSWITRQYQVCTASHEVPSTYRHCFTRYETRPNPNYTPPDNPSGDRACKGITLADCLRAVARASNPTIQVPVGTQCEERTMTTWVCDAYETRSHTYPELTTTSATRLTIFEYTPAGFVRLDGKVREIATQQVVTQGLADIPFEGQVEKLTTSSEAFDLSIPGHLQTLQFQNGFLYAIASGVLQVYSMAENSLVRTSTLQVASDTLQSSLFSGERLYLSDFGYARGMDHSTLRVVDLKNPAFPKQVSQDYQLPGGHSSILATSWGILTIGSVANFENTTRNAVKLGLFADPFASEKAYLILATELSAVFLGDTKAHFFDAASNRLFLPYTGQGREQPLSQARIGISHLDDDAIVSDGALGLEEPVQRVRRRPGTTAQVLGFGQNTVEWLTPEGGAWKSSSVLAYFTPIALYRRSDGEDYVEVSRLGTRCKLHFAEAAELNAHGERVESEPFECGSSPPMAYADNILFGDAQGVSFDDDGTLNVLASERVQELVARARKRQVCLFSTTPTTTPLDYAHLPPADDLVCYSPEEYQAFLAKL